MRVLCAEDIKKFIKGGIYALEKEMVKDGGAISNMYCTLKGLNESLEKCSDVKECCDIAAKEAVKNAKGNSGIILAQMLKGFKKAAKDEGIDSVDTGRAFYYGNEYVEKCLKYRRENTMAYSVKKMASAAMDACIYTDDACEVLKSAAREASLCACDDGSCALCIFMEGAVSEVTGHTSQVKKELKYTLKVWCENADKDTAYKITEGKGILRETGEGYFSVDTNNPVKILEGMDVIKAEIERRGYFKKKYVLAAAGDEKNAEIYMRAGIELINENESINGDTVFVMAESEYDLEKAKKYCDENENAVLVETVSLPQVMWAVTGYSDTLSAEENKRKMTESALMCKWGGVIEGEEGVITSIAYDGTRQSADTAYEGLKNIVEGLADENTGVISLYYSDSIGESEINSVADYLYKTYKNADIEIHRYRGKYLYEAGVV